MKGTPLSNFSFPAYFKICTLLLIWNGVLYTNKILCHTIGVMTQLLGFSRKLVSFSRTGKLEVSHSQKCFHLLVKLRNTLKGSST